MPHRKDYWSFGKKLQLNRKLSGEMGEPVHGSGYNQIFEIFEKIKTWSISERCRKRADGRIDHQCVAKNGVFSNCGQESSAWVLNGEFRHQSWVLFWLKKSVH